MEDAIRDVKKKWKNLGKLEPKVADKMLAASKKKGAAFECILTKDGNVMVRPCQKTIAPIEAARLKKIEDRMAARADISSQKKEAEARRILAAESRARAQATENRAKQGVGEKAGCDVSDEVIAQLEALRSEARKEKDPAKRKKFVDDAQALIASCPDRDDKEVAP